MRWLYLMIGKTLWHWERFQAPRGGWLLPALAAALYFWWKILS